MDEPLAMEWAAYRAACDAVDALRYHPLFSDPRADPSRVMSLAERVLDRRRTAVAASARLLRRAEREPGIDPEWLGELREEHEELLRSLPRGERLIAESGRRARGRAEAVRGVSGAAG